MSKFKPTEHTYKDFKYKIDALGNWSILKNGQVNPVSLYKYYPNNDNSKDAFIKNYFFLSHPYHLNDSLDSSELLIDCSELSLEVYKSFYRNVIQDNRDDSILEEEYNEDKKYDFSELRKEFWLLSSSQFGILSLADTPLNVLMWSHYSQESGFMIEIDRELLIENELKVPSPNSKNNWLINHSFAPVNYVEKLEPIPLFVKSKWSNPAIPFMYLTNVKRECWKYESEWRLICFAEEPYRFNIPFSLKELNPDFKGNIERKLYYSPEIIKSIVLGENFLNSKNVLEEVECGDPSSKIFKMKSGSDQDFIEHLECIYSDRIYQSGNHLNNGVPERGAVKLQVKKIECGTYRFTRDEKNIFRDSNRPV